MSMSRTISPSPRLARPSDATFHCIYNRRGFLVLLLPLLLLLLLLLRGIEFPRYGAPTMLFFHKDKAPLERWKHYTLKEAAAFVGGKGTVIVCTVSQPFLPFLNNWLISVSRQGRAGEVLVVAEDYATLYEVNARWPGHAVSIEPPIDKQSAHNFGSKGFFDITNRRAGYLLQILELGYNVMFNDVDMVWLADPFPYFEGNHDIYITDDETKVKPLNHSHILEGLGKRYTYLCACMIFLRPTNRTKKVMQMWAEDVEAVAYKRYGMNDQISLNLALKKHADEVDLYLLPQSAFPSGGLYFRNPKWVEETKGRHVIIHDNYIVGYDNKKRRFQEYELWLADKHFNESPLGKI